MPPRLALAGFRHLTNRFTPGQTGLDAFTPMLHGDDLRHPSAGSILSAALAPSPGPARWESVPILAAFAPPGGPVTQEAFEAVAADLDAGLQRARPNALLFDLPGTTILENGIAAETEMVARARTTLGPSVPIVVTGSPFSTLTHRLFDVADVVLVMEDTAGSSLHARTRLLRTVDHALTDRANLTTASRTLPLLVAPPVVMDSPDVIAHVLELAHATQRLDGVVHAGLAFGFAYADSPDAGTSIIVGTDGDRGLAERLADDLAAAVWSRRSAFQPSAPTVEEAVHAAMAGSAPDHPYPGDAGGPLVLLDAGDDLRSGAPGDGTALLWALLDLGAPAALLAVLVDPAAVVAAVAAGVGSRLELPLGAASGETHGFPIEVVATVGAIASPEGNAHRHAGRTALLHCEGRHGQMVEVVVSERRPSAGDGDLFAPLGVDPMTRGIVALKPGTPWSTALPLARSLLVDTPGPTRVHLADVPFRHVPRPIQPLDPIPGTHQPWGDG